MPSKECVAIMGCDESEFQEVLYLGINVYKNMFDKYAAEYPNPRITKQAFFSIFDDAEKANAATLLKGIDRTATRDKTIKLLYSTIKYKVVTYANELYVGDAVKLSHSGCPVSDYATPHGIPDKLHIKRIVRGPDALSAKIMLAKLTGVNRRKKEKRTYKIWKTTDPSGDSGMEPAGSSNDSRKLIVRGLKRLEDVYYGVTAVNSAGESEMSGLMIFTAVS